MRAGPGGFLSYSGRGCRDLSSVFRVAVQRFGGALPVLGRGNGGQWPGLNGTTKEHEGTRMGTQWEQAELCTVSHDSCPFVSIRGSNQAIVQTRAERRVPPFRKSARVDPSAEAMFAA